MMPGSKQASFRYGSGGDQVLKNLRQKYWSTPCFRRDGADQVVAVAVPPGAALFGIGTKKIRLKENLGLTAALIRNSLLNTFAGHRRSVLNHAPIRFIAREEVSRLALPARTGLAQDSVRARRSARLLLQA